MCIACYNGIMVRTSVHVLQYYYIDTCVIVVLLIEATPTPIFIAYKSIVLMNKQTRCNSNFWYVVSGHIDIHPNIKRFDIPFPTSKSHFLTKP